MPVSTIAVHGGAGTITTDIPPELQAAYRERLRASLRAGWKVLEDGGNSLDAVCASVKVLEDSPLFNAGKGAVFTKGGKNECEASVMVSAPLHTADTPSGLPRLLHGNDWFERGCPAGEAPVPPPKGEKATLVGLDPEKASESGFDTSAIPSTRRGAGVTLVSQTKNPILLARTLYLLPIEAPHVLLSGQEAEQLGWSRGTTKVDPSYYWTRRRWLEHRRGLGLPDDDEVPPSYEQSNDSELHPDQAIFEQYQDFIRDNPTQDEFLDMPKGTVGACAIDAEGRLAVATSTGGKTNKSDGRIGDTPSIGAGFWAERFVGSMTSSSHYTQPTVTETSSSSTSTGLALSGTGDGDYFLRVSFASLVAHRMRFLGELAEVAGRKAVEELGANDGNGGAIVLDHTGQVTFPMNSNTMNRGVMTNRGGVTSRPRVALFQHEHLS